MNRITTWRELIANEMAAYDEHWGDVVHAVTEPNWFVQQVHACDPEEPIAATGFDTPFDAGRGGANGDSFTVWTEKRVYFPAKYDGGEWCSSVPRHPCNVATEHVGGG